MTQKCFPTNLPAVSPVSLLVTEGRHNEYCSRKGQPSTNGSDPGLPGLAGPGGERRQWTEREKELCDNVVWMLLKFKSVEKRMASLAKQMRRSKLKRAEGFTDRKPACCSEPLELRVVWKH